MAVLGDIAIIGYSADTAGTSANQAYKGFAFVILSDLAAGDTIFFTDNGWLAAGGFRTGEGTYTYTVPTGGVTAGTVVTVANQTGSFNLSTGGDQILAYVGSAASPTFLYALEIANNQTAFDANATSTNTSALPPGLTFGQNAFAFGTDNGAYTGSVTSGTKAEILAAIANTANWTLNDTALPDYKSGFTVTGAPADAPGSFTIGNASVTEGDTGTTPIAFQVNRTGGSTGAVDLTWTVNFQAGAGRADAGDFAAGQPLTGTVHFDAGDTAAKTISLAVLGDTAIEGNETFTVTLSAPTAGTITTATGTGTIIDNDTPPAGVLSIAGASVIEGNSGTTPMSFVVSRANGSFGAVTANYAVSFNGTANAADLAGATSGTVSFADGETSKTITINVAGDTVFEPNETFSVVLSSPTGNASIGTASATGTITNDDAAPPIAPLFINELHYDNVGTDSGEFIEIAGSAGTSLAGWQLLLYNGNGGLVYSTTNLTGTIADQNNGYGTLSFSYPVNGIQNGNPDGIALVGPDGSVVQFLSYGGEMTANGGPAAGLTSVDIGVAEAGVPVGLSLQLTGTGATYEDFTWTTGQTNTAGQINTGQSFLPTTGTGFFRVNDPRVVEGNSGTSTLTFTVTRSGGSASAGTVDYQIALDGTADANDLAPGQTLSGTLSFAIGETAKTVSVTVRGDTTPEPNETLSLHLSNPTGDTAISDAVGIGTIVNDDPITLAIYTVQGAGHRSEYVGQRVTTTGIVTSVSAAGYYLQDAIGDGNRATSDAIYVATGGTVPGIAVGASVTVSGTIGEVGANGALSVTQFLSGATSTINSTGNALPAAVLIGTNGILPPTNVIDDDRLTSYDPTTDGIDFYESLEGMRVTVDKPLVVARSDGGTYVVASDGAGATGVNAHGGITISAGDYNPERILVTGTTGYTQGDQLGDVTGIITYASSTYRLEPTATVTQIRDVTLTAETTTLVADATHLTVASFNMENLDPTDAQARFNLIAQNVVYNLQAPSIIAAQEIQDADGAGNGTNYSGVTTANMVIAAIDALGGPHYSYVEVAPTGNNQNGGEPGGNIRPGIFYRADQVSYVADSARQVTGQPYDGSRKPLVADFLFNGQLVTIIDMHSTSRLGSDSLYGATQPPVDAGDGARTAQAAGVKDYIDSVLATDPNHNFIVGGDFNGFYFETALQRLGSNGMTNLANLIPSEERYSYLFDGNLQLIDNILASNALYANAQFDAVHINTLLPTNAAMATDHDQVISRFYIPAAVVNHAPVAVNDAVAVNEDATTANLYASLLANDTDQDPGTTLAITGVDTTGTLGHVVFDAATRSLQYVADADAFDQLPTGSTATDTFSYTVSDGTLTSTATVTVTITGIADGTTFNGGGTADTYTGTPGDDRIYGNAGNDVLRGGEGADFIAGGIGNDMLFGDAGRDILLGGAGNDSLNGGDGNDYLSGDLGNDSLSGGAGADTFAFGPSGGRDTIMDFDASADRILLTSNLSVTAFANQDLNNDGLADLVLTFSNGTSAVLWSNAAFNGDYSAVHIDRTSDPLISQPIF